MIRSLLLLCFLSLLGCGTNGGQAIAVNLPPAVDSPPVTLPVQNDPPVFNKLSTAAVPPPNVDASFVITPQKNIRAPLESEPTFTIAVYPDSQNEVDANINIWQAQNQWVLNNKVSHNIVAVLGVGDIANAPTERAYTTATSMGYDLIHTEGLPYLPLMGNHDWSYHLGYDSSVYDKYFGPTKFAGKPWYLGGYPSGSNANMAISIDAGTVKLLVIGLEAFPRREAVSWAQSVIDANPARKVIIVTHFYLRNSGTRSNDKNGFGFDGQKIYNPQELWDNFIKLNPRISLVLGGHDICTPNMAVVRSIGKSGNNVIEVFTNYQCAPHGGDGYITLLKFRPFREVIEISSYSSYLQQSDPVGTYVVPYNLDK